LNDFENPIEKYQSKIKNCLRKAKAGTRAELEKAMQQPPLFIVEKDVVR